MKRCAWLTPPLCRECNERPDLCECRLRRPARYFDELENLYWLFSERPLRAVALRAHQKEFNALVRKERARQAHYWLTVTERAEAGYERPESRLRDFALSLGDSGLRRLGLSNEAVYALHFRDRMHPDDLRALYEHWSERMAPQWSERLPDCA